MFGSSSNKKVGVWLTVVASCLVLVVVWAVLATPATALAKKPGGDGRPEILHGSATFRDVTGDAVKSDDGRAYVDGIDGTVLGLEGFFRLEINLKKNGGRSLELSFPADIDSDSLPKNENIWVLRVDGRLTEWRAQGPGLAVPREGYLLFGQTGKDEAFVSYGRWGGSPMTVKRTGPDQWTIESLTTDTAVFYRNDTQQTFGSGPMPFRVSYDAR